MKRRLRFPHGDNGAETIEAALIYPFVLLIVCSLIYLGLFILQYMTVNAYAQKIALLAAREVAYPGYISLVSGDAIENSAVEIALDDYSKAASGDSDAANGCVINFPTKAYEVHARAYRYWSKDPLESKFKEQNASAGSSGQYDAKGTLEGILKNMIDDASFLKSKSDNGADVKITCKNDFIAQYVYVDVTQEVINMDFVESLGWKKPAVHVHAMASVNDTDEFIRNTNFVCDCMTMIAKKLGIDVNAIRDKVNNVKETLHLD